MNISFPKSSKPRTQKPLMIVNEFNTGTVTLVDQARLSPSMASESVNLLQTQDGLWSQRWGRNWYGTAISAESTLDGVGQYVTSTGARELIAVGGTTGTVYRSQNDGVTWTALTGATLTAGKTPYFKQLAGVLLITNGTDNLTEYNGTTTLVQFASLAAPASLAGALTGLTTGSYTVYYQVTALNAVGETVGSTELSKTVNILRDNWVTGDYITLTWTATAGATSYNIYYSGPEAINHGGSYGSGYECFMASWTGTTFVDDGTSSVNYDMPIPTSNTTSAPKFRQMELSDNKLWSTNDTNHPYRVYWSADNAINFAVGFSGGGYVDLETGGKETPIAVMHYRNGTGDSAATVLCSDSEGIGSIWQITLTTATMSDGTEITVPIPVKVVGSIGTTSPYAVLAVQNDIYFPNKQGVYTLGNAQNLLNVLATNEKSQLIRPSYRSMNQNLIGHMCGIYYDAKVFFSCAVGTANDTTFIFDTERQNWNWSWNFGAKMWFEATDANGMSHLLYVPSTGNQLVEVSSNFSTDFGAAFNTSYISGLMPFSKDDTMFAKVKDIVITFSGLLGTVNVEVLGMDAKKGFTTLATKTITTDTNSLKFVEKIFGQYRFSHRDGAPVTFASANTKKWVRVAKKMNAIQIHVYSSTAGTEYSLLSFVVQGEIVPTFTPQSWKH